MTTLPGWVLWTIGVGTPLLAFAGSLIGHLLLRRGATELDVWRRREETMRMLRWASEQATSTEPTQARMGIAALDALSASELLQEPDQVLVDAVIDSLISDAVDEVEQAGGAAEVIEIDNRKEAGSMGTFMRTAARETEDMARVIHVTPAQVWAAKLKIKRAEASGKPVPASVTAIANARRARDVEPVRQDGQKPA